MERNHRCKICLRDFANGKALGGHMRAHMMKFYAEERARKGKDEDEEEEEDEYEGYENYLSASEDGDEDGESEIEDTKRGDHLVRRRSKRVRKLKIAQEGSSSNSNNKMSLKKMKMEVVKDEYSWTGSGSGSGSGICNVEEHVANCLIMLSRDKWTREDMSLGSVSKNASKKYKCKECGKVFNSYQALGGHRASHNKLKANGPIDHPSAAPIPAREKIHECPFCHKIFASGQALGGHKRSHFIGGIPNLANANATNTVGSRTGGFLDIDLNLPAPLDDDDNSQNAASGVTTDAECVPSIEQ